MTTKNFHQIATVQDYEELFFECGSFTSLFMTMQRLAKDYGMRKCREYEDELYKKNYSEYVGYRDWETDRKSTRLNSSH